MGHVSRGGNSRTVTETRGAPSRPGWQPRRPVEYVCRPWDRITCFSLMALRDDLPVVGISGSELTQGRFCVLLVFGQAVFLAHAAARLFHDSHDR